MPPDVVSHYQVLEPVGRGGMGVVHKGRDLRLGRVVALKFLSSDRLASAEDRERFYREARALSALNHPHIATLYEVDEIDGTPFMSMEYLPGGTLRERLQSFRTEGRSLPVSALLDWGIGLAEALEHAHGHGIVHRDVKSSNVMFDEQGRIKLTDFGLAKAHGSSDLTASGQIAGTVGYMAPEQILGSEAEPRSDLYALGVLLYETATTKLPFRGESPAATIERILHAVPEPPGQARADLPPDFDRVVTRLMAKTPGERYPDASLLIRDLRAIRSGGVPSSELPTATLEAPSHAVSQARPRLMALGGLALAALLAVGAYLVVRTPPPPAPGQIAVLPIQCPGADADQQVFCDGLTETLASALSETGELTVTPAGAVRRVNSVEQARRELGVNLAVSASLERRADEVTFSMSLMDAKTNRTVGTETIRGSIRSLDEVDTGILAKLAGLIGPSIPGADATILDTSASKIPGVFEAYVRGRGFLFRSEQAGHLQRALEEFYEALRLCPSLSVAHAGVAEARLLIYRQNPQPGVLEAARAAAQRAVALDPNRASTQVVLGEILVESRLPEKAIQRFESALRSDPRNSAAYSKLASVYRSQKRFEEAEAVYERAIRARPGDWACHADLAKFLYKQQRFPEAAAAYRKVIELVPDNNVGYRNLGGLLHDMGDDVQAEAMLLKALALRPTLSGLSNLGTIYMIQGRYREATPVIERAAEMAVTEAPTQYIIWGNLGDAHWLAGDDPERARTAWRRAAEIAEAQLTRLPGEADLESVLAEYYAKLEERERAKNRLDAALTHGPQSAFVHYQAGVVHAIFVDYGRAVEELRLAVSLGDMAAQIRQAPELRGLRESPEYRALVLPSEAPR